MLQLQPLSALDDVVPNAAQRALLEADAEKLRAIMRQRGPGHQTFWLDFFAGQTSFPGELPERTRCTFERLALAVMRHHTPADGCLGPGRQVRGVEWWVQARCSSGSHEPSMAFHFDSDEELKGAEGVHKTPWLATVTYLGSRGAPTVVLPIVGDSEGHAELLPETSAASGTFISYPVSGKHIAFDGGLLHGVLSQMSSSHATAEDPFVRCTLLVNIWCNHRPLSARRLPADIAMQLSDSPDAVCFAAASPLPATLAPRPPSARGNDGEQQRRNGVAEAWDSFDVGFIPERTICDAHPGWETLTHRCFPFAHPSIGLRYLMSPLSPTAQPPSKAAAAAPSLFYAPFVEMRLDNAVAATAAAAIAAATATAVVGLVEAINVTDCGSAINMTSVATSALEATTAAAATVADTLATCADAFVPASRGTDHRLAAAATAVAAAALAAATAATAAATMIATATSTAATLAEAVAVAASAPELAQRAVPEVFAHRLASQADACQLPPAARDIFLAIPGRGGVWRPASDDEHAPDNVRFQRFFSALPSVVRQCLVDRAEVDPHALVEALPNVDDYPTETALDVLRVKGAVDAAGCSALRRAVDAKRSLYPDSVDGMPEHQFDITREELEGFIGKETVAKLWRLPRRLASQRESGVPGESSDLLAPANRFTNPEPRYRVELFLRRYSRGTRPLLSFHRDSCAVTANVALSADEAHTGGRLLAILDDGVQAIVREEGEVTVHPSDVLHAVTAVEAGVRYSLLVFFFAEDRAYI